MAGIIGAGASALGSIVGGIAGQQAGSGDMGEARNQAIIANNIIQALQNAPDISKPLILQQYRQAGILTPQMENQINAQVPGLIKTNQQYTDAQNQALNLLSQRANEGLTGADRAALIEAQQGAAGAANSQIQAINQQEQQEGVADSGSALASKLAAAQGGANTAALNSSQLAQQQQQARDQALSQLGSLGTQLQQNQFNQNFQQQQAQNEMNRFNVQNQLAVQAANTNAANQAQAANLANAQNMSNMNTQQNNQEQYNQLQRQMQQWQANTNLGAMKAGSAQGLSGTLMGIGQQNAQNAYNTYAGMGQMAGGIGNAIQNQGNFNTMMNAYNNRTNHMNSNPGYNSSNSSANFSPYSSGYNYVAYDGGQAPKDFKKGGPVPGQANVPGDSPRNDTVHAMLSPGEIVVPRSLAESKIGKEILKLIHAHNSVKNKLNGND